MAEFDVDLFVIGGGSGGVRAARIAAGYGARVVIAEEYRMGGTCVIRGCVPKKLFVIGSHIHHEIEDAAGFGWTIPPVSFDWPTLVANKDKEIARLEGLYTVNVEKSGAQVLKTRAVLEDAHTLRLADGKAVTAKYILIATGSAPNHGPEIPGIEHVISSNEAFHLPALPRRVVIQGGGYIALEFACIFAGFGSDVTVVYRGDNILRGFDADVRGHVRAEMERQGITILTGCTVDKIDKHGREFTTHLSNGSSLASEQVMFAIGRHPNIAGLGLDKAGVALIRLATPTSDDARLAVIARRTAGFIYYVSVAGVTGVKAVDAASVGPAVKRVRKATGLPVAVGFGIRTPEQAAAVARVADAVVVGSALVDEIAAGLAANENVTSRVLETAARLAQAVRAVGQARVQV